MYLVGSSSGSAVAVSANVVPIALGTETDTSVIGPANYNGIVGIKPTVGLTSRSGVIPISENFDTVGVFGRTVHDACLALNAISGVDEQDSATMQKSEIERIPDYTKYLASKESLKGANFGLPMNRFWLDVENANKPLYEQMIEIIRGAGATICETEMPCWKEHIPEGGLWDWFVHEGL